MLINGEALSLGVTSLTVLGSNVALKRIRINDEYKIQKLDLNP